MSLWTQKTLFYWPAGNCQASRTSSCWSPEALVPRVERNIALPIDGKSSSETALPPTIYRQTLFPVQVLRVIDVAGIWLSAD
jgi:hypothetical protein